MPQPKRIVAAIDLSAQSQRIIEQACSLAKPENAELYLLYVGSSTGDATPELGRFAFDRLSELEQTAVDHEIQVEKFVLNGIPHREIVEFAVAKSVDLIVMGTHGRKGISHFALGSVAERVIRNSPCPVQVIKSSKVDRPLEWAMSLLSKEFDDQLNGEYSETRKRILQLLVEKGNQEERGAIEILRELENREWVLWKPDTAASGSSADVKSSLGHWYFMDGVEFVELGSEFKSNEATTPGIDLIRRAKGLRATDIHLDPFDRDECRVRLRIDGKLTDYCRLSRDVADQLANQWKTMANLDISDPFRPKEGRIEFPTTIPQLRELEARITTAPVHRGEAVAIRIFSREEVFIPLKDLGLDAKDLEAVNEMLRRGEGLVLVTGPTGAGKTITVYSMLETIGASGVNIVSVEDPVEFSVPFVRQMAIDERHDITMTNGLKTMLRMDPDVVFLGEIRDRDAAEIAMRAASSGHYVFSTLHTRDVASVVTALRDLGLDDRSLASNITGITNQRLLRRLCTHCREAIEVSPETRAMFSEHALQPPEQVYLPKGCTECRGSGYYGRIGVFEAISLDDATRDCLATGKTESAIRQLIRSQGTASLTADALRKVSEGVTDLDEAIRVRWAV